MPRFLRLYLPGCIALTFGYLLLHATEPLRLNVGDPVADATVIASITDPRSVAHLPLAASLYRALAKLGVTDIGTFRLLALALSALAVWAFFQYVRRLWSDAIALIATALLTTSLLWMMHADSLDQMPITQAAGFVALWGLVRAIETRHLGYVVAAVLGASTCCLASYDYWLFLPVAALFTVHVKLGEPLGRDARRFLIAFAAACTAGMLARLLYGRGATTQPGLFDYLLHYTAPLHAGSWSTLVRRWTVVLTPMFWITIAYTLWRVVRVRSLASILDDTWLLVVAMAVLVACWHHAGSQMVTSHVLLPFYAVASATLISRLLEGSQRRRALAFTWVAIAPLWSFYLMVAHTRSLIDRADVAKVETYLAANDRNDFLLSNLLSDMPIQAVFGRNSLSAPDQVDTRLAELEILDVLAATGTDYVDALIFTTADSRFVDPALQSIMGSHHWWSVTGWPYLQRAKTAGVVAEYDRRVLDNLAAVDAKRVLHLSNFDVYRIDRARVLDAVGRSIPVMRELDFGSTDTNMVRLLGWGHPWFVVKDGYNVTSLDGYRPCAEAPSPPLDGGPSGNACETVATEIGLAAMDRDYAPRAQLMIRAERACDLRLTFELEAPSLLKLSTQDFTTEQCTPSAHLSFVIPEHSVRAGINLITIEKKRVRHDNHEEARADVLSLTVEPMCGQPP